MLIFTFSMTTHLVLDDDPFSAVDAHTGMQLFQECILGALSTKTVVYVIHQVEFLPAANLILVLRDGKIAQVGKYDELLQAGTDFSTLVGAHNKALEAIHAADSSPVDLTDVIESPVDSSTIITKKKQGSCVQQNTDDCNKLNLPQARLQNAQRKEHESSSCTKKNERRGELASQYTGHF